MTIAGVALLALTLSACGSASNRASNTGSGAASTTPPSLGTVSVTTFPTSVYLTIWAMEAEHLDQKYGFTLDEIKTTGGATLYTPLVGGQADTAEILPELTVQYAVKGVVHVGTGPLAVVPALSVVPSPSHPATAIFASTKITNPSQLKGQLIATHNPVSGFYISAQATLAEQGVTINNNDPKAAHSTVLPIGQMGAAVAEGRIAAGIMDYVSAMAAQASGEGHILEPVLGAGTWNGYPYVMWAFNRNFLSTKPQLVQRFLEAVDAANNWIIKNPGAAKNLLVKTLGMPSSVSSKFLSDYPLDGFRTDLTISPSELQSKVSALENVLVQQHIISQAIPVPQLYDDASLVSSAQAAWSKSSQ